MSIRKEAKDEIISLLLQNVPTDEIARRMNYSIWTIRETLKELREEYSVSTTKEIVNIYVCRELDKLSNHITNIQKILQSSNVSTPSKNLRGMHNRKNKTKK